MKQEVPKEKDSIRAARPGLASEVVAWAAGQAPFVAGQTSPDRERRKFSSSWKFHS